MTSPTLGVVLLTDLAMATSACCGVVVAAAELLPGSGSNWSLWLIVAVLVWALALLMVARLVSVSGVVAGTVPTLHRPVVLSYVPRLGVAETKVRPPGSRSVTATSVAASGPALVRVIVKVMVSPTLGRALLTDLARARSACCGV